MEKHTFNNGNIKNSGTFLQGATIEMLNIGGGNQTITNNYHRKETPKKEEPTETIAKWLLRKVGL